MTQWLFVYLLTLPVLIIVDLLWIGVIANSFYVKHTPNLRDFIAPLGAILFYLVYTAGILLFVTEPHHSSIQKTLLYGAALGFVVYGVYNFVNLAVLKDWAHIVVVVDTLWGTIMTAAVATAAYYLAKLLL